MFRTSPAAEPPTPSAADPPAELIALSHLALDLDVPPEGWATFLADRGVQIVLDDLGRASVARADARRLFTERRENEARRAEIRAAVEQQAVERDQAWRAQLGVGVPASAIPHGMTYGEAVASAELDSVAYRPRASVVEDLLSNDGSLTFHSLQGSPPEG